MRKKRHFTSIIARGVIILALLLFFHTLYALRQGVEYSYYTVSSVMMELMFIILITSTYIDILKSGRPHRLFVKLFLWMLALVTMGMLGDVFAWGLGLERLPCAPFLRWLGAFLRDATGFPLMVIYSIYLISYINENPQELKRYAYLVGGLCADGLLLVIISRITALSTTHPWHLWDYPWLFFFFLAMPMVVSFGIIFYFRRALTSQKTVAFLIYELVVLAAVVLDILIPEVTLAYSVTSFSLLRIYISVQLEYEKKQEDALVQQRISIMLSQIQPHFLYNVLTGIRTLCRIEPKKAEDALLDFTNYLRANLNSLTDASCIPFSQELAHTHHYLQLEKMRYGDDLSVDVDTPVTQFSLPALTLEPIVENAVRHGVMQRETGGSITIRSTEDAQHYLIIVTDNGVGFDTAALEQMDSRHVGLTNVRERLSSMCAGDLEIRSAPGEGTTVTISIPKQGGTQL